MVVRWRPMQRKDVPVCVEIVASHPVIGPRYGPAINNLRSAWLRLLGYDAMTTAVFEEVNDARITIVGAGVGVFVRDEFIRELKTPPLFWFGPELMKRITAGNSPVLTDREVREANSGEGLNELVWETLTWTKFAKRTDVYHLMGNAYVEIHRGFLFKEMITSQAESAERLQWAVDAGGLYWDPLRQHYAKSPPRDLGGFVTRPHVVGITRELEFARPGSWVGTLFDYHPPRFGFSRSEQQLMLSALTSAGGTDRELASALNVSVPTVKKMWVSIYHRVVARDPELIPDSARLETGASERGREKRRRLLAYLREHPEELRPISQRLMQRATGTDILSRKPA
jgi:hypothetical protein